MARRMKRRAKRRTGGKMKAGSCKRVGKVWLCKPKSGGRVKFSKTKKY